MEYYISNTGSDSNNGTTEVTAWQTFANVTPTLLQPGDIIWLKGGHSFTGNLVIESVGTQSQPIFISSDSRADILCGSGDGVRLVNPEYIFVNNLQIIGSDVDRATNSTLPTSNGCGITAISTATIGPKLRGVRIANNIITGTRTGILMQANDGSGNQNSHQGFTDWHITQNEIYHTSLCGIFTWAAPGSPTKPSLEFGGIYPEVGYARDVFTDFLIERNYVHDNYGYNTNNWSQVGWGTGIRTMNASGTSSKYSLVQYNRIDNGGHAGSGIGYPANFEAEVCDYIIWQFNESSRCKQTVNARDGAGYDVFDGGVRNCILQYNYAYLNDGYGIGGGGAGGLATEDNICRFNILVNNNQYGNEADMEIWGHTARMKFYNNIVYNDSNDGGKLIWFFKQMTDSYFANNILVSLGNKITYLGEQSAAPKLLNNLYWRGEANKIDIYYASNPDVMGGGATGTGYLTLADLHAIGQESLNGQNYGLIADPLFNNPGTVPSFLPGQEVKFMTAYKLLANSPAIGAGIDFSSVLGHIGTKDYYQNSFTGYSIGAEQIAANTQTSNQAGFIHALLTVIT